MLTEILASLRRKLAIGWFDLPGTSFCCPSWRSAVDFALGRRLFHEPFGRKREHEESLSVNFGIIAIDCDCGDGWCHGSGRCGGQTTQHPRHLGDDIGTWNVGVYTHGMMGRTPNIDSIAEQGMLFTDHYAQPSCTAGRAAFITGQHPDPHRHDHHRHPRFDARHSKGRSDPGGGAQGTGLRNRQFGKNHLGDRNEFLPTVHGFDEWFGNLYHLNAEEEPEQLDYPGQKNPAYPQHRSMRREA